MAKRRGGFFQMAFSWLGLGRLKRDLEHPAWIRARVLYKRTIDYWTDQIVVRVRQGNWFDAGKGDLQRALWSKGARRGSLGKLSGSVGWAHRYGPVMEWGPREGVRGWLILPKFAKALRFQVVEGGSSRSGGQTIGVVYARSAVFKWEDHMMRPHFGPTIDKLQPRIDADLAAVPGQVYAGGGVGTRRGG